MNIPDSLFYPEFIARGCADDPVSQAFLERLRAECEEHLTPGRPEYIDADVRQAEWWTTRMGGKRLPRAIEHLAVAGLVLEDRYTDAAQEFFRVLVKHRIAEQAAGTNYGRPYHTWRDNPLDAGSASLSLAISFDLLRPLLTSEESHEIGAYLIPFVDYLLEHPPDPGEAKPDWNIACIGMVGLGLLALGLQSSNILDGDRGARALELGKRRALLFLEKGHDGDGAFFEGPGYGAGTLHCLAPFAWALARCGDRELVEHEGWLRIVEGFAYELIPGTGKLNPLNDCSDVFNVDWLALVATEHRSGLAQWVWQKIVDPFGRSAYEPPNYFWTALVTRYLLFYDPTVEPEGPERAGLSTVKHFRNRGLVDLRTGWEEESLLLSFVCDVFPSGGHRQADRNHFALHVLGESFAIDSGYGLEHLPDTTEVLRFGALGEAHNVPLAHGEMQRRVPAPSGGIRRVELGASIPYIEAEAGESYLSAERFTRRLIYLPSDDGGPGCVVVADLLTFRQDERLLLSWLLHTHPDNVIQLTRDRITLTGGRKGHCCDVHIVTSWPGRWRQDTFLDHTRLRYDWFWNPLLCLVVLSPYRAGDRPPDIVSQGTPEGCMLRVRRDDVTDTILSALPGHTLITDGLATDAEFALLRTRDGKTEDCLFAAGTHLTIRGQSFLTQAMALDFLRIQ